MRLQRQWQLRRDSCAGIHFAAPKRNVDVNTELVYRDIHVARYDTLHYAACCRGMAVTRHKCRGTSCAQTIAPRNSPVFTQKLCGLSELCARPKKGFAAAIQVRVLLRFVWVDFQYGHPAGRPGCTATFMSRNTILCIIQHTPVRKVETRHKCRATPVYHTRAG